jgi:hypothetical protein
MKKLALSILLLISSQSAISADISGHQIPDALTVEGTQLVLNGAGMREKFFIDLYVGGLYLPAKNQDAKAIISADSPMTIRLQIVSDRINSKNMTEATLEGFQNATGGNTASLQAKIDEFLKTFQEAIKIGDVFELTYVPEKGVQIYKNGALANTIAGKPFKEALFGIWLSEKPAQKSLKEGMLGA